MLQERSRMSSQRLKSKTRIREEDLSRVNSAVERIYEINTRADLNFSISTCATRNVYLFSPKHIEQGGLFNCNSFHFIFFYFFVTRLHFDVARNLIDTLSRFPISLGQYSIESISCSAAPIGLVLY